MPVSFSARRHIADMTGGGIHLPVIMPKQERRRLFFIEFFLCNPAGGGDEPVFGQHNA